MKLPCATQPTARGPAGQGAAAPAAGGVGLCRVQPQKTSGQCTCFIHRDGYWRPGQNGCWTGVPQCNGEGVCNCVDRITQKSNGAARDTTGWYD
jgi:hypothetical protein